MFTRETSETAPFSAHNLDSSENLWVGLTLLRLTWTTRRRLICMQVNSGGRTGVSHVDCLFSPQVRIQAQGPLLHPVSCILLICIVIDYC